MAEESKSGNINIHNNLNINNENSETNNKFTMKEENQTKIEQYKKEYDIILENLELNKSNFKIDLQEIINNFKNFLQNDLLKYNNTKNINLLKNNKNNEYQKFISYINDLSKSKIESINLLKKESGKLESNIKELKSSVQSLYNIELKDKKIELQKKTFSLSIIPTMRNIKDISLKVEVLNINLNNFLIKINTDCEKIIKGINGKKDSALKKFYDNFFTTYLLPNFNSESEIIKIKITELLDSNDKTIKDKRIELIFLNEELNTLLIKFKENANKIGIANNEKNIIDLGSSIDEQKKLFDATLTTQLDEYRRSRIKEINIIIEEFTNNFNSSNLKNMVEKLKLAVESINTLIEKYKEDTDENVDKFNNILDDFKRKQVEIFKNTIENSLNINFKNINNPETIENINNYSAKLKLIRTTVLNIIENIKLITNDNLTDNIIPILNKYNDKLKITIQKIKSKYLNNLKVLNNELEKIIKEFIICVNKFIEGNPKFNEYKKLYSQIKESTNLLNIQSDELNNYKLNKYKNNLSKIINKLESHIVLTSQNPNNSKQKINLSEIYSSTNQIFTENNPIAKNKKSIVPKPLKTIISKKNLSRFDQYKSELTNPLTNPRKPRPIMSSKLPESNQTIVPTQSINPQKFNKGLINMILELQNRKGNILLNSKFRELSKQYHPNKGGNAEKFIKLSEAYNLLKLYNENKKNNETLEDYIKRTMSININLKLITNKGLNSGIEKSIYVTQVDGNNSNNEILLSNQLETSTPQEQ